MKALFSPVGIPPELTPKVGVDAVVVEVVDEPVVGFVKVPLAFIGLPFASREVPRFDAV